MYAGTNISVKGEENGNYCVIKGYTYIYMYIYI